jgi:hypothetical protein
MISAEYHLLYHKEWQTQKHGPSVMLVEADINKQNLRRAVAHVSFGGPQCDGCQPMKRPPSGDARSAPARCVKRGVVCWQRGVPRIGHFNLDCEGTPAFRFHVLNGLSAFVSLISLDC